MWSVGLLACLSQWLLGLVMVVVVVVAVVVVQPLVFREVHQTYVIFGAQGEQTVKLVLR